MRESFRVEVYEGKLEPR